jgi:hypothetical protein
MLLDVSGGEKVKEMHASANLCPFSKAISRPSLTDFKDDAKKDTISSLQNKYKTLDISH